MIHGYNLRGIVDLLLTEVYRHGCERLYRDGGQMHYR